MKGSKTMKHQRPVLALLTLTAALGVTSAAYALSGGSGNDTLWIIDGVQNAVYGNGGNDKIYADHYDRVNCGTGSDTLYIKWRTTPTAAQIAYWYPTYKSCETIKWY
jgi:Ca2+-binding RTX toxin-like protein